MKDFGKILPGKGTKRPKAKRTSHAPAGGTPELESKHLIVRVSDDFWIEIASATWKLRQKVSDPITREPKGEMRSLARSVDAIWDSLLQVGLEIQDHTNQPFDSGQSLEVLAFQPTPGISREVVLDTIKPTIYFNKVRLQMGQVIVATPQEAVRK